MLGLGPLEAALPQLLDIIWACISDRALQGLMPLDPVAICFDPVLRALARNPASKKSGGYSPFWRDRKLSSHLVLDYYQRVLMANPPSVDPAFLVVFLFLLGLRILPSLPFKT